MLHPQQVGFAFASAEHPSAPVQLECRGCAAQVIQTTWACGNSLSSCFKHHIGKAQTNQYTACQSCQPVSASCIEAGPGRRVPSGCPAVLPWRSLQPPFLCSASVGMQLPAHSHVTCNVTGCTYTLIPTCTIQYDTHLHKACQLKVGKHWKADAWIMHPWSNTVQNARSHHRNE